jgi:ABC-type glycerol-3-phosphate transport system substrate-binding protein
MTAGLVGAFADGSKPEGSGTDVTAKFSYCSHAGEAFTAVEQRFIATFNEKHQNVTIEYERFGYGWVFLQWQVLWAAARGER